MNKDIANNNIDNFNNIESQSNLSYPESIENNINLDEITTNIIDDNKNISNNHYKKKHAAWSDQHENILIEWADKAMCYRWLHSSSHLNYSFKNRWFTIPVIIMSTLTGTANFALERIPDDYKPLYSIFVGSFNIFAGILTTIQQFLKITELSEAHRVSSIGWDKFYRNIKLELAKSRSERMSAFEMLTITKEEFDRLMETSPSISNRIINRFNNTFAKDIKLNNEELLEKKINFKQLHKPEICNELKSTRKYLCKDNDEDLSKLNSRKILDLINENNEMKDKLSSINNFISNVKTNKNDFKIENNKKNIIDSLSSIISSNINNKLNSNKFINKHNKDNDKHNNITIDINEIENISNNSNKSINTNIGNNSNKSSNNSMYSNKVNSSPYDISINEISNV